MAACRSSSASAATAAAKTVLRPGIERRTEARALGAAAAVAAVSIWLASGLEIHSSFQELLPSDLPSVRLIQEMVKRVGGDGTVFVNIESLDGPEALPACEALAPKLAQDFLSMGPDQIRAVDWNVKGI